MPQETSTSQPQTKLSDGPWMGIIMVSMIMISFYGIFLLLLESNGVIRYVEPESTTASWLSKGLIIGGLAGFLLSGGGMTAYESYLSKKQK